jgi:hypothetical protein
MMTELTKQAVQLHPAGTTAGGQREVKLKKAEEVLIEEILKAAGLESLN